MKLKEYIKKELKKDIIFLIFYHSMDKDGNIDDAKLEKYLRKLLKTGELKNKSTLKKDNGK